MCWGEGGVPDGLEMGERLLTILITIMTIIINIAGTYTNLYREGFWEVPGKRGAEARKATGRESRLRGNGTNRQK